jgi:hypothetical protein
MPEVAARGLVVARSGKDVMFCGGGFGADFTAGPPHCAVWARATGVDLPALAGRATARGVTWGTAYLAGTLRAGTLRVSKQGPPRPAGRGPRWVHPPCSAPAGGWATGAASELSGAPIAAYQRHFRADVTVEHPALTQ